MRYLFFLFGVYLLIVWQPSFVLGQDFKSERQRFSIERWSDSSGFPADVVTDMTISANGYLWFATPNGLIRFDGMRFFVYNSNSHEAISDNRFLALSQSTNGGVIAINHNEVVRINSVSVHVQPVHNITYRTQINEIVETQNGTALISIPGIGIIELDRDGNQSIIGIMQGMPSLNITKIHRDLDDVIWVGTDKGIAIYKDGRIEQQFMFGENYIQNITHDNENNIWFGTKKMGAFHWGDNLLTQYTTGAGLSSNNISSIAVDDLGIVWLGTNEGDLNQMIGSQVTYLTKDDGLPQGNLKFVLTDGSRTIWAATERAGVVQLRKKKVQSLSTENGLDTNLIQAIYEDIDSTVWVGTFSDGIIRFADQQSTTLTTADGLLHNTIHTIFGTPDGTLYIGTPEGLNRISNGSISVVEELRGTPVQTVFTDKKGVVWAGTEGFGLYRFNGSLFERYITYTLLDESVITTMISDSRSDLWVGTNGNGFGVVTPDTTWHYNGKSGMDHNFIYSFLEDSDGTIWIGTGSGLLRFDYADFEVYTTSLGLLNNEFYSLIEDDRRNIWSTSNNGIQYFSIDEINLLRKGDIQRLSTGLLGINEGLPTRQFNNTIFPSGWLVSSGQIWFPTMRGIILFDPIFAIKDPLPIGAFIEQLKSGDMIFGSHEKAILEPGTLSLEIEYTAPEYYNPDIVQFRYRLLGFDESWTEAGTRRTAYYSGLKPGNYTFEIQATHEGQPWFGSIGSMEFRISPYFYQSNWFVVLLTLGILFIAFTSVRLRIKSIREQELTQMVEARTKELKKEIELHKETEKQLEVSLQEKIVLIKEMHHRVKNNLTLIYALFELQMSKIEDKKVMDILTDSQFRLKSMAMLHEQLYQNELLAFIQFDEFLKQLAQSIHHAMCPIGVEIHFPNNNDKVSLDINQSVPAGLIMNELITNACKHAFTDREKGLISVELKFNDPEVVMIIEDDGIGLPTKLDFTKSGTLGLELISTLVSQLSGTMSCSTENGSRFEIRFKKDA